MWERAQNSTLSLCIVGARVGVGAPHIWVHSVLLQSTAKMQEACLMLVYLPQILLLACAHWGQHEVSLVPDHARRHNERVVEESTPTSPNNSTFATNADENLRSEPGRNKHLPQEPLVLHYSMTKAERIKTKNIKKPHTH